MLLRLLDLVNQEMYNGVWLDWTPVLATCGSTVNRVKSRMRSSDWPICAETARH